MNKIYLIPEVRKDNPFFYANKAEQITIHPITVSGYRLWAIADYIDTYSSPYRAVAVSQSGKFCKMYPVRFPDGIPDFEILGFSLEPTNHGIMVFMKGAIFLEQHKDLVCIPVPKGDWNSHQSSFHILSALYHLSIIPTMSKYSFKTYNNLNIFEGEVNSQFGTSGLLKDSIASVFTNVLFGLEFFGFFETDIKENNDKYLYLKNIMKNKRRFFAFQQIDYAISMFNSVCFPYCTCKTQISSFTYKQLLYSVDTVSKLLLDLGYTKDLTEGNNLLMAIESFQTQNRLKTTGKCDSATFRVLWNEAVCKSIDIQKLMKSVGYTCHLSLSDKKSMLIPNSVLDKSQLLLKDKINKTIGSMSINKPLEKYFNMVIQQDLGDVIHRCGIMQERLSAVSKRTDIMSELVSKAIQRNLDCEERIKMATDAINEVIDNHIDAQQRFVEIREQIIVQRKRNRVLTLIGIIVLFVYIWKFAKKL